MMCSGNEVCRMTMTLLLTPCLFFWERDLTSRRTSETARSRSPRRTLRDGLRIPRAAERIADGRSRLAISVRLRRARRQPSESDDRDVRGEDAPGVRREFAELASGGRGDADRRHANIRGGFDGGGGRRGSDLVSW